MSKKLTLSILLCSLLFLIVFPIPSSECVKQTLVLWYQNVLPALLPALLLVHLLLGFNITRQKPQLVCLLIGTFCGFPLGCQCVCEAVRKGQISKETGQLYAAAFNQFSPVFLSSYVATAMLELPVKRVFYILYGSHFLLLLPLLVLAKRKNQTFLAQEKENEATEILSFFSLLDRAIVKSSETLVKIGGYMLCCSLLRTMLTTFSIPSKLLLFAAGTLETTSGIAYLATVCSNPSVMRLLALSFTAFGGICGFLQVNKPLESAGLKKRDYLFFKTGAGLLAALLYVLLP